MLKEVKLSAVIITYNEEKNIGRCLHSLQGIADEIIVLDSFSSDKTEQICRQYQAKFYQHIFDGHIQQKNRAITYATWPYIISLDADEALSETLRESILSVKKDFNKPGYYMNRLTNYCGVWIRHSGWYPDKKLRLFKKNQGSWGGINPHDKYTLTDGDSSAGYITGDILHYSYYNQDEHYRQTKYFSSIAARAYYEKGIKGYWYKLILNPVTKFFSHYILRKGFLDGAAGFAIAKLAAWGTYLKYKELRQLWKNSPKK